MRREVEKYLYDIRNATRLLRDFTSGRSFVDYQSNGMLTWTTFKLHLDDVVLARPVTASGGPPIDSRLRGCGRGPAARH